MGIPAEVSKSGPFPILGVVDDVTKEVLDVLGYYPESDTWDAIPASEDSASAPSSITPFKDYLLNDHSFDSNNQYQLPNPAGSLSFLLNKVGEFSIEGFIQYRANATSDIQTTINYSETKLSGAVGFNGATFGDAAPTVAQMQTASGFDTDQAKFAGDALLDMHVNIKGSIKVDSITGILTLSYAQRIIHADTVIVRAGSYLTATQIG